MDLGIRGKVALVAASTGGLGRAVAAALAAEGARVVVTGRDAARAEVVAGSLPGGLATGAKLDIGSASIAADAARIDETVGPIDILVTNGPGPKPGPAEGSSGQEFGDAFELLFAAQQQLIAAVLPGMRERKWGRILAIGSSGVVAPLPNLALSNVGRAALAAYIKTLAAECAADGVTANLLLPGRISTERIDALDEAAARNRNMPLEKVRAESHATIPAGRYRRPDEFGSAAAFLCGDVASYITGVALRCDGGLVRAL